MNQNTSEYKYLQPLLTRYCIVLYCIKIYIEIYIVHKIETFNIKLI